MSNFDWLPKLNSKMLEMSPPPKKTVLLPVKSTCTTRLRRIILNCYGTFLCKFFFCSVRPTTGDAIWSETLVQSWDLHTHECDRLIKLFIECPTRAVRPLFICDDNKKPTPNHSQNINCYCSSGDQVIM